MSSFGRELFSDSTVEYTLEDLTSLPMDDVSKRALLHELVWQNWNIRVEQVNHPISQEVFPARVLPQRFKGMVLGGKSRVELMNILLEGCQKNKNLFDQILSNHGFSVRDLGIWHWEKGERYTLSPGKHSGIVEGMSVPYFFTAHYQNSTQAFFIFNSDPNVPAFWER